MIGLLYAILCAVRDILRGQDAAAAQAADDLSSLTNQLADLSAAVEHLRVLVEGDEIVTAVGAPTFTPTGGSNQ